MTGAFHVKRRLAWKKPEKVASRSSRHHDASALQITFVLISAGIGSVLVFLLSVKPVPMSETSAK